MRLLPLDLSLNGLDAMISIVDLVNKKKIIPDIDLEFFPRSSKQFLYPADAVRSIDDFGRFWKIPNDTDNKTLELIWKGLNSQDRSELTVTIYKIPKLLEDFPPGFFLQPPFVYQVCKLNIIKTELVDSKAPISA